MSELDLPQLTNLELTRLVNHLSDTSISDELLTLYNNVKEGQMTVAQVLADNKPTMYYVNDEDGTTYKLSATDLDKVIALKDSFIGKNGNIPWGKLNKLLKDKHIDFKATPATLILLETREKDLKELPEVTKTKTSQIIDSAFKDETAKLGYQTRQMQNKKRELNKKHREFYDDVAFREALMSNIPKVLKLHTPVKRSEPNPDGGTLIVGLSDLHVGLKTKDYDYAILQKRLDSYVTRIETHCVVNGTREIIIAGLGDFIEGAYLHATQLHELEFDFGEQVSKAITLVFDFIEKVRDIGLKTSYTSISGNHDRSNGANKKDNLYGDSIVKILNSLVKEKASDLDITYIEPTEKIRTLLQINGTNICLVHGDVDRVQSKDIIAKLSDYLDNQVDVVLAGHLHSFWMNNVGYNKYVVQSSSAFNGNSYSESLGVRSTPGQVMLNIAKDGMVTPKFVMFK